MQPRQLLEYAGRRGRVAQTRQQTRNGPGITEAAEYAMNPGHGNAQEEILQINRDNDFLAGMQMRIA